MSRIRGNIVDVATKKILKKIENYELLTGDIVSDLKISREFNMSRTPIREAIMSLIDYGILERTQTKVVVKAITLLDIFEILDVRDAIEQKSIEIIFNNNGLNDTQKSELLAIHEKLCQNINNGDFDSNFDSDDEFHNKIIEYSGNKRLSDIYHRLSLQIQRLRWLSMLTPSRYYETRKEHDEIIHYLLDSNVEGAKNSIHKHLLNSKQNYKSILDNPQWINIAMEMKRMSLK